MFKHSYDYSDPKGTEIGKYVSFARRYVGQTCKWRGEEWIIRSPHVFEKAGRDTTHGEALLWYQEVKREMTSDRRDRLEKWMNDLSLRGLPPHRPPATQEEKKYYLRELRLRVNGRKGGVSALGNEGTKQKTPSAGSLLNSARQALKDRGSTTKGKPGMSVAPLVSLSSISKSKGGSHGSGSPTS